jgi:hypothetical protein
VARPTAILLDWWLGVEGIAYLHERDVRSLVARAAASGDDIGELEATGVQNFLDLDDLPVIEEGEPVHAQSIIRLAARERQMRPATIRSFARRSFPPASQLFDTLDWLETRLSKNRYLLGETITEADWRLFPTLFRFDAIYYSLFKCNLSHIYEQPTLWSYTRGLYQMPGIAATCDIDQCKLHRRHQPIRPHRSILMSTASLPSLWLTATRE